MDSIKYRTDKMVHDVKPGAVFPACVLEKYFNAHLAKGPNPMRIRGMRLKAWDGEKGRLWLGDVLYDLLGPSSSSNAPLESEEASIVMADVGDAVKASKHARVADRVCDAIWAIRARFAAGGGDAQQGEYNRSTQALLARLQERANDLDGTQDDQREKLEDLQSVIGQLQQGQQQTDQAVQQLQQQQQQQVQQVQQVQQGQQRLEQEFQQFRQVLETKVQKATDAAHDASNSKHAAQDAAAQAGRSAITAESSAHESERLVEQSAKVVARAADLTKCLIKVLVREGNLRDVLPLSDFESLLSRAEAMAPGICTLCEEAAGQLVQLGTHDAPYAQLHGMCLVCAENMVSPASQCRPACPFCAAKGPFGYLSSTLPERQDSLKLRALGRLLQAKVNGAEHETEVAAQRQRIAKAKEEEIGRASCRERV